MAPFSMIIIDTYLVISLPSSNSLRRIGLSFIAYYISKPNTAVIVLSPTPFKVTSELGIVKVIPLSKLIYREFSAYFTIALKRAIARAYTLDSQISRLSR
jgi:hypothetical protein